MRLSSLQVSNTGGVFEASGYLAGERLWFRSNEPLDPAATSNAFLAAGLLPAMVRGEPLEVEGAVSAQLLARLDTLQDIFVAWSPFFGHSLRKVAVRAPTASNLPGRAGMATFFSGGVDGWYTLLRQETHVSHLVFVRGIDMQLDNHDLFDRARTINTESAQRLGKSLVTIDTNIRFVGRALGFGWNQYVGSGLASLALLLGYERMYIPASLSFADHMPWGTHYLTDPLWSTEQTQLMYDGANAGRGDKLRLIASCERARDTLRVCWQDSGYNCGKCEKCLRTMMQLRALGVRSRSLRELDDPRVLRGQRITNEDALAITLESLELAQASDDRPLVVELQRLVRRYRVRKALGELDASLTGGVLKASLSWLRRHTAAAPPNGLAPVGRVAAAWDRQG